MARTTYVLKYLGNGPYGLDLMITYPRQFIRHVFNTGDTLDVTNIASPDELNRNATLTDLRNASRPGGALFSVVVTSGNTDIPGSGISGAVAPIEGVTTPLPILASTGTALVGVATSVSASDHVHRLTALGVDTGAIAASAVTLTKLAAAVQQLLASVLVFGMGAAAAGATTFLAPGSGVGSTSVELQIPVTRAGVLRNLFVKCQTAPGATHTDTVTVRVNGVNSALTCTVVNTATTGSDVSHAPTVAAGDLVSVQIAQGASSVGANYEVAFDFATA